MTIRTKKNNSDDLNLLSSWNGAVPGSSDSARWTGDIIDGSFMSWNLGANTTWDVISMALFTVPLSSPLVINDDGFTLTLNTGFTPVAASTPFTINCKLALGADGVLNPRPNSNPLRVNNVISGAFNLSITEQVIMTGVNTYSGTTTVTGSGTKLLVNSPGSLHSSSAVTVQTNATIGGSGTINGTLSVSSTGTLFPGSTGTASVTLNTADVTFASGAIYGVNLNTGPTSDLLSCTGTVTLGGATLTIMSAPVVAYGTVFTIISASTLVTGTFNGLSDNAIFSQAFRSYQINYTSTTVTLTDITPPVGYLSSQNEMAGEMRKNLM